MSRPHGLERTLEQLIHYHDEPLSHPNSVPLYNLSELARQHVKVVLTGEGADELFGGYPRYHLARFSGALAGVPSGIRTAASSLLGSLPGHRAGKLARALPLSIDDAVLLNSAYVDPAVVGALTGTSVGAALDTRRELVTESLVAGDPTNSISRYEMLTYLPCALDRMDRMSMAHGLEGRVPFLDIPLVEWGLALSSSLKVGLRSNKRVVKRLAEGILSPRITHGPKSGFGLPLDAWFRGPELAGVMNRIDDPRHPAASNFDRQVLQRIVRDHRAGTHDHGEALWLLANVFLWAENNRPAERSVQRRDQAHYTVR